MNNKLNAKLGYGIGPIKFGQNQEEVNQLLGEPNKKYTTEYGNVEWCYYDEKCVLKFEKENDFKLGWIEVYNPNWTLFGKNIIGLSKEKALEEISKKILCVYEVDDYGSWESIMYEESFLELQFKLDKLTQFNFGYLYDEKDQPIWPS